MQNAHRKLIGPLLVFLLLFVTLVAGLTLRPVSPNQGGPRTRGDGNERAVTVKPGEGLWDIASDLEDAGLVRSRVGFSLFSLLAGAATKLKAGTYLLSPVMSTPLVVRTLALGLHREAEVVIPQGASLYQVDGILASAGVLAPGDLIRFKKEKPDIEGKLFPDTYRFFAPSKVHEVVEKMTGNFEAQAAPLLAPDPARADDHLILASLIEKEVPEEDDRRIVAGILKRRLAAGMPLQVDASICYLKQIERGAHRDCYPLTPLDFKIDSPYNTYLYKGLPPFPIGNPGLGAIRAALSPQSSPYWFYLSDPQTRKTIFSVTLDEHTQNRVKYLSR